MVYPPIPAPERPRVLDQPPHSPGTPAPRRTAAAHRMNNDVTATFRIPTSVFQPLRTFATPKLFRHAVSDRGRGFSGLGFCSFRTARVLSVTRSSRARHGSAAGDGEFQGVPQLPRLPISTFAKRNFRI